MPTPMTWGPNDDVLCLDIELKLILERLLVCIMLFLMISILDTS
jgi:hypothetical protein